MLVNDRAVSLVVSGFLPKETGNQAWVDALFFGVILHGSVAGIIFWCATAPRLAVDHRVFCEAIRGPLRPVFLLVELDVKEHGLLKLVCVKDEVRQFVEKR